MQIVILTNRRTRNFYVTYNESQIHEFLVQVTVYLPH